MNENIVASSDVIFGNSIARIDALLRDLIPASGLSLTYRFAPAPSGRPEQVLVEFGGSDCAMLIARNAELLLALEHVVVKMLRLEHEEHDRISFDAGGFKAARERDLKRTAEKAVLHVRQTGTPYAFPPMSSHERRLLHLALASSGLFTESEGQGAERHLVLYPRAPSN